MTHHPRPGLSVAVRVAVVEHDDSRGEHTVWVPWWEGWSLHRGHLAAARLN